MDKNITTETVTKNTGDIAQFFTIKDVDCNDLINEKININFNVTKNQPGTGSSGTGGGGKLDKLNGTLTAKQQKWLMTNMYLSSRYNPTTDFVINLEKICKTIGYKNKNNAHKTLVNNFTVGRDFTVVKEGEQKEQILLNLATFKTLCLLSKSDKGKEIREYYLALEQILR